MFVVRDIAAFPARASWPWQPKLGDLNLAAKTGSPHLTLCVSNYNINISLSLNAARHAARLTSLVEGIWLQA